MRKTRLNEGHRDILRNYARNVVTCEAEARPVDTAYACAEPMVRNIVEATFPPRDMKVCEKYKVAGVDDCIKLKLTSGAFEVFNFVPGTGPVVTQKTYNGQVYEADILATEAVGDWILARDAHKARMKEKLLDYDALIRGARTFEEIVDIWPEAEAVRDKICAKSTALVALGADAVERIKVDVASRQ